MGLCDLLGVSKVGLAHLEETPAGRQKREPRVDEIACERVEDDVGTARRDAEGVDEAQIARARDVLDAKCEGGVPLPLARGREDPRADPLCDLNRRHADAAGRRVYDDALARSQGAEIVQCVPRGEKDDRHGGRLVEREAFRRLDRQPRVDRHVLLERATGHHGHDP